LTLAIDEIDISKYPKPHLRRRVEVSPLMRITGRRSAGVANGFRGERATAGGAKKRERKTRPSMMGRDESSKQALLNCEAISTTERKKKEG
jgi:hypothetical protein